MPDLVTLHLEDAPAELSTPKPVAPPSPAVSSRQGGIGPATVAEAPPIHVRKARLPDARNIFDLVNSLSGDGTLLRRSYAEICENIRDFAVAEV